MSHRSVLIHSGPPTIWNPCRPHALRMMLRSGLFVIVTRLAWALTRALSLTDVFRLIVATSNVGRVCGAWASNRASAARQIFMAAITRAAAEGSQRASLQLA